MKGTKRLGVFCSASSGLPTKYYEKTKAFGLKLASYQFDLIYGGASIGMMGALADSVIAAGGHVTGVIPQFIADRELAHQSIHDLQIVHSMHERKERIYQASDFIAVLPGGLGTLDEAFEFMTWNQLALHQKKIAFLNWENFYSPLRDFCQRALEEKFVKVYDNFSPTFFHEDDEFFNWLLTNE